MSNTGYHPVLDPVLAPPFPKAVLPVLRNPQLRKNVAHAIDVIQAKRARLVNEKDDWQELRDAGAAIRDHALANLAAYLEQFEERCTAAGGVVHWAADAEEARHIILEILKQENANEVIKIKTMTSAEIQLNPFLEAAGVKAYETDLAEIILQLGHEEPSHIVVPALHVNRSQVREIFSPRRPGAICGRSFSRFRRRSAGPTFWSLKRDQWLWWSQRATDACALRCRKP
jgi:L-lactate dehydrogenase complex protein LldF